MKKMWAKIMKENRIKKDCVIEVDKNTTLYDNLKEVCYILNLETPIILKKHNFEIIDYNITRFRKSDFVDSIDFDYLQIEYFEV